MNEYSKISTLIDSLRKLPLEDTIIDDDVALIMKKVYKEVIEKHHKHDIYRGSDGRWRTYIPDSTKYKNRRLIAKRSLDDLEKMLFEYYTGINIIEGITVESLYPDWLDYKRRHGTAETTILKYESDWKAHYKDTPIANKPIVQLDYNELDEWAHELVRINNMTKKDYINVSTIIRQILNYAVVVKHIIDDNPMKSVRVNPVCFKPTHKKPSETQVFSKEQFYAFRKAARSDIDNKKLEYVFSPFAVLLMTYTALRVSEVCVLKFSDIEKDELHVQRMYVRDIGDIKETIKGSNDERTIQLTPGAMEIIELLRKCRVANGYSDDGFMFAQDGRIPYRAICDRYKRYCDVIGIPRKSTHKMRKTVLTALNDEGMSLEEVRKIAGHKDQSTLLSSYVYDWNTKKENRRKMISALDEDKEDKRDSVFTCIHPPKRLKRRLNNGS